jgi:hypothetical protein
MNIKTKKRKVKAAKQIGLFPAGTRPRAHGSRKQPQDTYTPMEIGQPDEDEVPDIHNPQAVQGGLGPLNEDGEGDRQNDQIAELEHIEPKKY